MKETNPSFTIAPNGTGWKSSENQNLLVIESGESRVLLHKILKAIRQADEMICLQSFLIQDTEIIDALLEKTRINNVKVFILSSAETRLKETIEEEPDFVKTKYIQLLHNKFRNSFVHRSADNFHAKFILIDPKTNPKGFICTNNFTENGFVKNPELAVELNTFQCLELFKIFVYHFWEYSAHEQNKTNEFGKVIPARKFQLEKPNSVLLTSPNTHINSLNKALTVSVSKAIKSISLSTFTINENAEIIKLIKQKAIQNISVRLFCKSSPKNQPVLKHLAEAGIQIYLHPLMHAKSLLIDESEGFIFTSNIDTNGLDNGFEVGLKLNTEQTEDLYKIHQNWQLHFPEKMTSPHNNNF